MSAPIIELRDVWLRYRVAKQRASSLKEHALHWLRGGLQREDLWALRDLTVSIGGGERVGLVGRNGAGKSTMLKLVARIFKPTQGTVAVRGRMAPILELGTGFDYELTGLENVYLSALMLGRRRREVTARERQIVEFSGLGDFVRAPIRSYSSGMLARLAFSVATAWPADVLILDEVLAVGDAEFLARSRERLAEFQREGTTLLLVSHRAPEILETCTRCLWLEQGRVRMDGRPIDVLALYGSEAPAHLSAGHNPARAIGS